MRTLVLGLSGARTDGEKVTLRPSAISPETQTEGDNVMGESQYGEPRRSPLLPVSPPLLSPTPGFRPWAFVGLVMWPEVLQHPSVS